MSDEVPRALGRYLIVSRLATGGMAELFLASRTGPNGFARPVAVKHILPHLARQPSFVAMFLDEARIAAQVNHPNVVKVEDLGNENGELFMAMEYLSGLTVARLLRQASERGLALPPVVAAHIGACVAAGLHAAHELTDASGARLGLVHRDVSPDNVFVTFDGQVKLLDFGVAKVRDGLAHTKTGEVKGKASYMSPEQWAAEPLDPRSDIFSLGVMLHEMFTGRRLFNQPNSVAVMRAIVDGEIAPPSATCACSPALDAVVMKALSRPRDQRYATAAELRAALLQAIPPGTGRPEEELGALLRGEFPEVEAQAVELVSLVTRQVPGAKKKASRVWPMVAAATVLLAMAGGGAWALRPVEPVPVAVAPPPPPVVVKAVEPPRLVKITVVSTPAGARVRIDGEDRGLTPVTIEASPREAERAVQLQLDGYAPVTRTLAGTADQQLEIALEKNARAAKRPPAKGSRFHRFE